MGQVPWSTWDPLSSFFMPHLCSSPRNWWGGEGLGLTEFYSKRLALWGRRHLACEVLPSHRWTVISDQSQGGECLGASGRVGALTHPRSISMPSEACLSGWPAEPGPASQTLPGACLWGDTSSRHKQVVRRILVFGPQLEMIALSGLEEVGVILRSASKGSGRCLVAFSLLPAR